jgi:two-component system cell cycle sensor histidine kinase/response regulator CckA
MSNQFFFWYILALITIVTGVGIFLFRLQQRNLKRHLEQFTRSFEASHAAAEEEQKRIDNQNKRIEAERAHTRKMEALGKMAGTLAHNFNNYLTASGGYATLLKRRLTGDTKCLSYIEQILEAGKNASEMLGRVSLFVKNDQIKTEPADINKLVTGTIAKLRENPGNAQILPPRLTAEPSMTSGDPGQLDAMIYGIGRNAAEACQSTGGTVLFATDTVELDENDILTRCFSLTPGAFVRITVTDTGCGMDEPMQHRIFEPFFTTKPKGKGIGLSLAYVWWYIKTYRGALEVESQPDRGTTFRMYLPLEKRYHPPSEPLPESNPGQPSAATAHVLIVDDEPSVRDLYTEILEDSGYTVDTCCNGREAMDFIGSHPRNVDLVLLDLMMPVMDGAATFKAIRTSFPAMKVLLMSGYKNLDHLDEMLAQPPVAFFEKAGDGEQLLEKIREMLA